ncbi:MAG: asparagine synthase (glutamine-hydrolyzing) [Limnohabitans sp.]
MCGVAGYIVAEARGATPIMVMAAAIAHRGPDDEGYVLADVPVRQHHTFSSGKSPDSIRHVYPVLQGGESVPMHHLAMAQVRYSIIDLSAHGHQPMWSACGRYCITFNGEIFNYIELRDALKAVGRVFATQSDTEVLLQAYIEWGVDMFERLNGFFAFALYDVQRQQVLLGRDRIGKAHLYLAISPQAVHWASEIKALIKAGQVDTRAVDPSSVADFLIYGRRDRAGTFWQGVLDFPPGHYAWVGLDCKVEPVRYWAMPTTRKTTRDIGLDEASTGLRELLIDALVLRLRADVPIGFELSGGMDSSALVGLAAGAMGRKIKTYTIKFDEAHSDEEPHARAVAQRYPDLIDYTVIRPPQDEFWKDANRFVWEQEEPFHAPNLHTSQAMQRLIKQHGAHVVISGAAGDEMLAGYAGDYIGPYLRHLLGKGNVAHFWQALHASTEISPAQSIKGLLWDALWSQEQRSMMGKRRSGEYALLQSVLAPGVLSAPIKGLSTAAENSFHGRTVANMTHRMMNYWMRSGMKSSYGIPIEPRAPFLDYRVVEFCSTLPPEYLIHDGWLKYVLRKAVEPYLPADVVWRRNKMGFPFPYREWLTASKPMVLTNLAGLECPFINLATFAPNYDRFVAVAPVTLWRLISILLWWKRVVEGNEIGN